MRSPDSERILVISDREDVTAVIRKRYPQATVSTAESYLQAIHTLGREAVDVVIGEVDPCFERLDDAVGGLREAGGDKMRLILCCRPEAEPATRRALGAGADTYLLLPLSPRELDQVVLRESPPEIPADEETPLLPASMPELQALGEVLAHLEDGPAAVLERLATVVRLAVQADGAEVSLDSPGEGSGDLVGKSGRMSSPTVLVEPIPGADGAIGRISVGPRSAKPYSVDDAHKLAHYAVLAGHILEVARRQQQWQDWALTDALSGLANRRHLMRFLNDVMERAHRERFRVTLLLFDIDDFKTYNDLCGHDAGDEIIRIVARLFRQHCREHDMVARYGGDEFAVVFWDAEQPRVPGSKHPADALAVLKRVKKALGKTDLRQVQQRLSPEANRLTISGGLASYPWDASTPEELIARADEALLQAKAAGKNRIYLVSPPPNATGSPGEGAGEDDGSAVDTGV